MKVDITDGRALSALSPTALTAYLCARGWSAVESDAAFAVFERAGDSDGIGLDVPLRAASRDYARRVAELLQNLELLEGRSQLEIYRDIFHANQDVVQLSVDVSEPGQIELDEASTALRVAAQYLKERMPVAGFELAGPIVRLQSAAPTAGGEVTIAGIVDGGIRQVLVSLGGDDYQVAVHAHHQELPVSVEGELIREGRAYRLAHPRLFAVMGPAASD